MKASDDFLDNAPDWRWETVIALVEENKSPSRRPEDDLFRSGFNYLRRWKSATKTADRLLLRRDYPDLFKAHNLYNNPRSERWVIEAGLMAQQDLTSLGKYIAQPESVIRVYGDFFFDVVDKLDSPGYVYNQVLVPAASRGIHQRDVDLMYKSLAYCLGWDVFTEFVANVEMSDTTRGRLRTLFNDNMLKLGYVATSRVEVNNFNAVSILELCVRIAEGERDSMSFTSKDESMALMQDLLNTCRMAILPSGKATMMHEPRAVELLGAAKMLKYGDPIIVGDTNGKN